MMKRILLGIICIVSTLIGSCSKDDSTNMPPQQNTLNASTTSVVLTSGQSRTVTISGGSPAYGITSPPSSALVTTARLDSANRDTAFLFLLAPVSTATGSTAVVVQDNSSPQKQVSISISKQ